VHELTERLLKAIRKQDFLHAGDRVAVAVSGGADSVALLLLLLELRKEIGIVLSVAHVNHKLRGAESDGDEQFVSQLAAEHKLEFLSRPASVGRGPHSGIEGEARRLRYEFFCELICQGRATKVATAHTLDDQAETVLLRLFRGTGIRGLAGIHPRLQLKKEGGACGEVVRPLLGFRRAELREYLSARGQSWREDSSNRDEAFLRNRLRARLIPLIAAEFGESAIEHISELAEIARAEEELRTQSLAASTQLAGARFDVERLLALQLAARRRVVRAWIQENVPEAKISFRLIDSVLELAHEKPGGVLDLPGQTRNSKVESGTKQSLSRSKNIQWKIRRGPNELTIERDADERQDYRYSLSIPCEVFVPELQVRVAARVVDVETVPVTERDGLLDPAKLSRDVVIRNWRAGDRYWPAHTKQEKKVKELLSDRHITGAEKKLWPVAESKGEIVWVRGFAAPEAWQVRAGKGIWIQEIPVS